jgi:hypothetical protein
VLTVNGPVELARAYYHCPSCRHGGCPHDADLGLADSRLSPSVEEMVALAGCRDPFRHGADLLKRLAGLDVSASTCGRVTEAVGADLQRCHDAAEMVPIAPDEPAWDFTLPPDPDTGRTFPGTVGYVDLDAFAVPTRTAGGRAWRMLYTGVLYDPAKEHTVDLCDFDHANLAATLRRYAVALGYDRAATVVALTDGGNGLEQALRRNFGGPTVFVLDFWHAAEHLYEFAWAWHGRDSPEGRSWAEAATERLRREGGEAFLSWLEVLGVGGDASASARAAWEELCGYVRNQRHRMNYPEYRARGWDIGSGPWRRVARCWGCG